MRFGGLIAAIVVAAIAAIVVLRMTDTPPPAQPGAAPVQQVNSVNIYVAAKPIPIGSTITQDMLAIQPWPEHLVLPGFITADNASQSIADKAVGSKATVSAQNVIGTVARAPFQQQEPIISTKLANPNDPNFLAADLPKGMRVLTIVTNETEGVAGFIFPGDHVDVILTHDVDREKLQQSTTLSTGSTGTNQEARVEKVTYKEPISETLINNVTVLAVDQRPDSTGAVDKDGKLVVPRSISLMVSQVDAQRIRLGQKIGTLTLSLRALADKDSADPATMVGTENVSQFKSPAPEIGGEGTGGVTVYRGAPHETQGSPANQQGGVSIGRALSTQQIATPTIGNAPTLTPASTGQR